MKQAILPEGNGQKVYFNTDLIKSSEDQQAMLYLLELGYDVVTDSVLIDEDTFFYHPCFDKEINKTPEEYNKKKTEKIHSSLEISEILEPLTLEFPKEEFPTHIPKLPFILKNEKENGGVDKVLIKTPEQLEIFKKFYEEINEYSFQEAIKKTKRKFHLGPQVIFTEDGTSNSPISIGRINYKQRLKDDFVMQEFIQTPTEYNTSLRVVTASSKDILCASLKYSNHTLDQTNNNYGLVDRYLLNCSSPYYLGSESIISNTVAGGSSILLGKSNYTDIEKQILISHEIDPTNAAVPTSVGNAALMIAATCKREIGAISGMDFIFNAKTKKWYYLEQHEYPMMNTYCEAYHLPYVTDINDLRGFTETQEVADTDARLRALSLTMQKKTMSTSNKNIKIKT